MCDKNWLDFGGGPAHVTSGSGSGSGLGLGLQLLWRRFVFSEFSSCFSSFVIFRLCLVQYFRPADRQSQHSSDGIPVLLSPTE